MKKKKLKKIAKLIFTEVNSLQKMDGPIRERVDYVPYDSEVSEKTKNLILKLIDYNENVNINFSSESFSISTQDITSIKKKIPKNTLYNDVGLYRQLWIRRRTCYEQSLCRDRIWLYRCILYYNKERNGNS